MEPSRSIIILLAEDDPDDRYLINEALDESQVPAVMYLVEDGEELLDYLNQRGKFVDAKKWPRPDLILLDLNMPRLDGREALAEIKTNAGLRGIPVVALTTSQAKEDIQKTYQLGVSGFITKPVSFNDLTGVMRTIGEYWQHIVALPAREEQEG